MKKILIVFAIIVGFANCQLVDVLEQDPMYGSRHKTTTQRCEQIFQTLTR